MWHLITLLFMKSMVGEDGEEEWWMGKRGGDMLSLHNMHTCNVYLAVW